MARPRRKQYIEAARALYQKDGEIEIDDDAKLSGTPKSEGGQYLQAWVWVYDSDATWKGVRLLRPFR